MCLLPMRGETRRALVIGLGKQLDKSWGKINGDKDVPLVTGMLKANGFTDITTLVNEQATKAGIENAFRTLAKRSKEGDIVYIHFSGHGQLMTDLNGDEQDKLDEGWIPYDAYKKYCGNDRGEKHLNDDEISIYMQNIRNKIGRKGTLAVIVDACHSGDSTRDINNNDSVTIRGVYDIFEIPVKKSYLSPTLSESWLTLSACKDYQLNQEYNGYGKLTYILTSEWKNFIGLSDLEIYDIINDTMQSRKYKGALVQSPHLSGTVGNVLAKIFKRK